MNKEKEEQVANEARQKQADRMMALCSRGEKCRQDICKKLAASSLSEEEKEEILQFLEKENLWTNRGMPMRT